MGQASVEVGQASIEVGGIEMNRNSFLWLNRQHLHVASMD